MQIGTVGATPSFAAAPQVSHAERAEKGPDNDHDADDLISAVAKAAASAPAEGRGSVVNIQA